MTIEVGLCLGGLRSTGLFKAQKSQIVFWDNNLIRLLFPRPRKCQPWQIKQDMRMWWFPFLSDPWTYPSGLPSRCTIDNRVTRVAWLNRSTILYAGNDKWCLDPRVVLLSNTQTQYSIEIQNVDVYDEGPYTCSVQTDNHPKTSRVHLIVQGRRRLAGWSGWMAGRSCIEHFFCYLQQRYIQFVPSGQDNRTTNCQFVVRSWILK